MEADYLTIAEDSYHRCAAIPEFFPTFYQLFLDSDSRVPPMFAATEFDRQNRLLKHGLGLLIIYAKRPNPALLERIATRHGRTEIDAAPELYETFAACLIKALEKHDPEFTPEVADAWRRAVEPGIAFMKSRY
jgi:hemoglobin-like flavoprotein